MSSGVVSLIDIVIALRASV